MTFRLIFHYIIWSIRLGIPPWYYFQINAEWYNKEKGFYSKIDIDKCIPIKWRLKQSYLDRNNIPSEFPVFLKPEWGQNSNGIIRINNSQDFLNFRTKAKIPYIVQYAAHESKEYEIFYIRDAEYKNQFSTINITQSINHSNERYPINGIYNNAMIYRDITHDFSHHKFRAILQKHLKELPNFRIARIGLKANSKADLLAGLFHIIEINLFAPFPIHLLDNSVSKKTKYSFIKNNMKHLVKVSNTTPKKHFSRLVFSRKIIKHYQSKVKQ